VIEMEVVTSETEPDASGTEGPELLSVDDAFELSASEVADLSERHLAPGAMRLFRRVGFDQTLVARAEGMYYSDTHGRPILDFFGSYGAMGLGHNHPRIAAVRRRFDDERRHEMALVFPSQYVAALSTNLARMAPGDLDIVFLCMSGSEANEIALRLAEGAARRRSHVVYAAGSFHGKTRAALSVTDAPASRAGLAILPGRVKIPFGDADALEAALRADPQIGTVILESIQGGAGIVVPPAGYLRAVRALCDHYGVLWIADEVQCGFGRTGRFFAFEHDEVVPDIVTMAKALGGGKTAVGAVIARPDVLARQPHPRDSAVVFGASTFAGMGETCVTAIEAINVLVEEGLMANAAAAGELLLSRLADVKERHPESIAQVRGRGCMIGIECANVVSATMGRGVGMLTRGFAHQLAGGLARPMGAQLFADHATLVGFTDYDRDVLRIQPPLIVRPEHIELLRERLNEVLAHGPRHVIVEYLRTARGH
jgi:ornithine--oxo-acid transaminase